MTIGESLERIKRIYKQQQTHAAPSEVVAQALGYTTINGASKGVIATLKQYGLLEGSGDGLRVSDQSVSILGLANEVVRIYRSNLEFLNAEPGAETELAEIHRDVPKSEALRPAPEEFRRPCA